MISNICRPEESSWYAGQKAIHVVMISFAVLFGLLIYLEVGVYY